jgi:hypothetical protein
MGRTLLRRRSLAVLSIAIAVALASWPVVALAEEGTDLASVAADATEATDQAAGDAVEETTDAADGATQDATQAAGDTTQQVSDAGDGATQDATQAAGDTTQQVTEAATETTDRTVEGTASLSEDLATSSSEVVDATSATASTVVTETSTSSDAAVQTVEGLDTQLADSSGEATGDAGSALTSVTDVSTMADTIVTPALDGAASTVTTTAYHPVAAEVVAISEEVADLSSEVVDATSATAVNVVTETSSATDAVVQSWTFAVATDVSSMATTVTPSLDGAASPAALTASRPVAAEIVGLPVTGSSWFVACPHACDQYEDTFESQGILGAQGILGEEESFTDSVISTIRSLAMTGLHLLLQMWSLIVLAILGPALIEATRRRQPMDLSESSRS